jgi:hypothetical protein
MAFLIGKYIQHRRRASKAWLGLGWWRHALSHLSKMSDMVSQMFWSAWGLESREW